MVVVMMIVMVMMMVMVTVVLVALHSYLDLCLPLRAESIPKSRSNPEFDL